MVTPDSVAEFPDGLDSPDTGAAPDGSPAAGNGLWIRAALRAVLESFLVAAASVLLFCWVFEISRADWQVPFTYSRDGVANVMYLKAYLEDGGFVFRRLAAPGALDHRDYPNHTSLDLFFLKTLASFLTGPGLIVNLYYALSYPMVAVAAYWSLKKLRVSPASSASAALLYAFLTYHPYRGVTHLFLTNYFLVPPLALIAIRLARGEYPVSIFEKRAGPSGQPVRRVNRSLAAALVVCLAAGQGNLYYVFMACVFFCIAVLISGCDWRRMRNTAATTALLIGALGASSAVQLLPTLRFVAEHGRNASTGARQLVETEIYGLRPANMFLPAVLHRVSALDEFRRRWDLSLARIHSAAAERGAEALGFVGAAGLLFLLLSLFVPVLRVSRRLWIMSLLSTGAILFATSGGGGVFFALLVTPQFRVLSRFTVFIGFLALAAAALGSDGLRRRWPARLRRVPSWCLPLCIVPLGVLDQVTPLSVPDYGTWRRDWEHDRTFVAQVERALPEGAMVFQIPHVQYPEAGAVHGMGDYQHGRAFVQSRHLRWSYGAVVGRPVHELLRKASALPTPDLVIRLRQLGFRAVWVDRRGFADQGAAVIRELREALPAKPLLASPDGDRFVMRLD